MTLTTCFRREVFDSDIMKESSKGMDYLYFLVAASLYTGIVSNALSIYKNGVDKMYQKSILKKKRSLYLLLPIALFSLILNKLDR